MASAQLARLSELLATIVKSTEVLRVSIQQEQIKHDQQEGAEYSARVASSLGLPFHADADVAHQASILRIACERLAQLVTPPRHLVFEAAGSVSFPLC